LTSWRNSSYREKLEEIILNKIDSILMEENTSLKKISKEIRDTMKKRIIKQI
jgi:hypothetical protein